MKHSMNAPLTVESAKERSKKTPAEYEKELSAVRAELANEKALSAKELREHEHDGMVYRATRDSVEVLESAEKILKEVEDMVEITGWTLFAWRFPVDDPELQDEGIINHFPCDNSKESDVLDDVRLELLRYVDNQELARRIWQLATYINSCGTIPKGCTEDEVRLARWWLLMAKDLSTLVRAARGFRDSLARTLPQLVG